MAADLEDASESHEQSSSTIASLKDRVAATAQTILAAPARHVLQKTSNEHDGALANVHADAAFNPTRARQQAALQEGAKAHWQGRGPRQKTKARLAVAAAAVTHPRRTAKEQAKKIAAGKISCVQQPPALPGTSLDLDEAGLEAQDAKEDQEEEGLRDVVTSDSPKKRHLMNRAARFQEQRNGLKMVWMTAHVRSARVVPRGQMLLPRTQDFFVQMANGEAQRFAWERWLGHLLLYYSQNFNAPYIDDFDQLTYDLDVLKQYVERLVMASAPWQVWAMRIRSVYRWDEPAVTGRWLALYIVLWYTRLIPSFMWASILYYVIRQRFFPASLKHLRASIERTKAEERSTLSFREIIDRHGREDWFDPLMDRLGPYLQLQLGDLADFMEILANFYAWKSPAKTAATLFFFGACLATSLLGDVRFNWQIVWFLLGGTFFVCWPVATNYPQYRFLVSPLRWVFWGVPTHADWAFEHLRCQCEISRAAILAKKDETRTTDRGADKRLDQYNGHLEVIPNPNETEHRAQGQPAIPRGQPDDPGTAAEFVDGAADHQREDTWTGDNGGAKDDNDEDDDWHSVASIPDPLAATDLASFPARHDAVLGRLVVHAAGLRFQRLASSQVLWDLAYDELRELRKFRTAGGGGGGGLVRRGTTGRKVRKVRTKHALEIVGAGGRVYALETLRERDEAFNWIVGFSGRRWQSLQPRLER